MASKPLPEISGIYAFDPEAQDWADDPTLELELPRTVEDDLAEYADEEATDVPDSEKGQ